MWIPSAVALILASLATTSAREILPSRKAILYPITESSVSSQRGSDVSGAPRKQNVASATRRLVQRIDTEKMKQRDMELASQEDVTWDNGRGSKTRDGLYKGMEKESPFKKDIIDGVDVDKATVGAMGTINGNNVDWEELDPNRDSAVTDPLLYSANDRTALPFGIFDSRRPSAKAQQRSFTVPSVTNTLRRQIGVTMPYCSIVPCRNIFNILGNVLASMRLYMLDKNPKYNENPLTLLVMTSASVIPLYITQIAMSPQIFRFLRRRWAFQGECGEFSVEYVLRSMLNLLAFESALKLALRVWFYGNNVNIGRLIPGFVRALGRGLSYCLCFIPHTVNLLGSGIFGGYWSMEAIRAVVHMFVHSVVFARLVLFTAAQHAFFKENYDTAAFFINPIASQLASILSALFFVMASTSSIGTMLMFKNFSNLADVEHLLDYTGFRTTESHAAATEYARNAVHNIPKLFKPTSLDILVKLTYYHEYLSRLLPRGIEWPVLLFHLTMALNSNSAAGIYLSLVNLVYAIINQRLSSYERSILTQDIQEIVQETR